MKKLLPKLKALLLFVFVFLCSMPAFFPRQVTGTVTDASSGEALIGATIQIKGTTTGTVTDMSGNYSISVDGPTDVLIFSYVGYDSKEETVGDRFFYKWNPIGTGHPVTGCGRDRNTVR